MHFSSAFISTLVMLAPATLAEAHNGLPRASKSYADTYLTIRTAVNAFSFAVDTRPVPSFDDMFTPNAVMNLSIAGSQQSGAANISTYLSGLLTEFKTQHNFGTQKIDISEDGKSAVAITSFTGTFWRINADPPMYAQYFQQYNDTLEEIDGAWLISNKVVSYMTPPLGNLTL